MTTKKEELTKLDPPGPLALPGYLKDVSGHEGLESITREDLILPRISVAQSLTPQIKKSNALYIEGLEEGQFFNNVTQEVLGSEIGIIPLVFSKSRIYFREMSLGGGILCQSPNGIDGGTIAQTCEQCPNSKFDAAGKAPKCTDFVNVAALLLPAAHLVVLSFKSTALKPARKWMTQASMLNKPVYCQVYAIRAVPDKRQSNDFFSPVFKFSRWATEQEYSFSLDTFSQIKGKSFAPVEDEHEAEDQAVPF